MVQDLSSIQKALTSISSTAHKQTNEQTNETGNLNFQGKDHQQMPTLR
jgi:hypothetical protein